MESLPERGLHGVEMITSDNHAGLKAARQSIFPSVPWQRCQFHLQQNASAHILNILVLSSSGAGKSTLQDKTLKLMPPEDVIRTSAIAIKHCSIRRA